MELEANTNQNSKGVTTRGTKVGKGWEEGPGEENTTADFVDVLFVRRALER